MPRGCSTGNQRAQSLLADHFRGQVRACLLVVVAQMFAESVGDDFVHVDCNAQSSRCRVQLVLFGGLAFSTMETRTSTPLRAFAHTTADRVDPNAVGQPQQHSRQIKKQHGIGQIFAALLSQLHNLRDKSHRSCRRPPQFLYRPLPTYAYLSSSYSRWPGRLIRPMKCLEACDNFRLWHSRPRSWHPSPCSPNNCISAGRRRVFTFLSPR